MVEGFKLAAGPTYEVEFVERFNLEDVVDLSFKVAKKIRDSG